MSVVAEEAVAVGAVAFGAVAFGAVAFGAVAFGPIALGAVGPGLLSTDKDVASWTIRLARARASRYAFLFFVNGLAGAFWAGASVSLAEPRRVFARRSRINALAFFGFAVELPPPPPSFSIVDDNADHRGLFLATGAAPFARTTVPSGGIVHDIFPLSLLI
jgi:hypothetical protein